MTQINAQPRQDARDLQLKLYREIGISAVAAALHFTTQADPAPRPSVGVDRAPAQPRATKARAA